MQGRVVREIRMLRAMWRELETGPRITLAGHEGGNPGYRQGSSLWVTAPALDPTKELIIAKSVCGILGLTNQKEHEYGQQDENA